MNQKVHQKKGFGIFYLCCGLFLVFASLIIGNGLTIITGLLFSLMGIVSLANPLIVYSENEVQLKNAFGMTIKRYSFSADNFEVKGNKVYVNGRKINASKGMLISSEHNALLAFIETQIQKKKGE